MGDSSQIVSDLRAACELREVDLIDCGGGHFQIKGPLLVNYYPFSKKRSAYVQRTTERVTGVSIQEAVGMAFKKPALSKKAKRKGHYLEERKKLWARGVRNCHWCGIKLRIRKHGPTRATLEHIVPLALGGLDNPNNWTLACSKCNNDRGCDMPELREG